MILIEHVQTLLKLHIMSAYDVKISTMTIVFKLKTEFDMDIENNGKSMTLEQAFDSILTKNFEEYVKPEEKKPLKKYKK